MSETSVRSSNKGRVSRGAIVLTERAEANGTLTRALTLVPSRSVMTLLVRNSTSKDFQFRAHFDRDLAFGQADDAGFLQLPRLCRKWHRYFAQQTAVDAGVCFIRITSNDGRDRWDFTTGLDEGDRIFDIVWSSARQRYLVKSRQHF